MEQIISPEELKELIGIKGEGRGASLKGYAEFILKEEGEEGLKKLEDVMTELGHPIKYREVKTMDFYPLTIEALTLVAIKKLFDFDDKKFQEMGEFEPKGSSLIVKLFMKYFVSIERTVKEVSKMWRKYYTIGDLKVIECNEEKRYVILRLENFRFHPLLCQDLIGYFSSMLQMVVRGEITCEETKCIYRGDEYHEFLLKW